MIVKGKGYLYAFSINDTYGVNGIFGFAHIMFYEIKRAFQRIFPKSTKILYGISNTNKKIDRSMQKYRNFDRCKIMKNLIDVKL